MIEIVLDRLIKVGRLTLALPSGKQLIFGQPDPASPSADVAMAIHSFEAARRIASDPFLRFGEAYVAGEVSFTTGTLIDFLNLIGANLWGLPPPPQWLRAVKRLRISLDTLNGLRQARLNVAHHYDLSEKLYRSFLDADLQYSCAYFERPDISLEDAQAAKKRHLLSKLDLKAGQSVLDICCGWGGLALEIARSADVRVLGITLSENQLVVARERARQEGLQDRVCFELIDFRNLNGRFDRIISVGMFEHVGLHNYQAFFDTVKCLLTESGVAVIHSIGRRASGSASNGWIRKYIFPGGYIPSLSEVTKATERANLWVTDVEILRKHYAETLKAWRLRFLENYHEIASHYDDRFRRMWEFYLAASEISFRYGDLMVFQLQVTRNIDALPITRTYMFERERLLEAEPDAPAIP